MASKACKSCLRTFQRQPRSIVQSSQFPRAYSTAADQYVIHPAITQTAGTSIPPVTPIVAEGSSTDLSMNLQAAKQFKKVAGKVSQTYTAYGVTKALYQDCTSHAAYTMPTLSDHEDEPPKTEAGENLGIGETWWHTELGLKPTFSTWSQVTMLHMYLLSVRFRCFPADVSQPWQQHLLDHFFYDAEMKMEVNHGMHARGTRNKYLKDLFVQWRGLLAAYDEGITKGDAVLAAALWRNVFKANEEVDIKGLAQIVSFMRKSLQGLEKMSDEEITSGRLSFSSPKAEETAVKLRSKMMELPFEKASGKDLPGGQ